MHLTATNDTLFADDRNVIFSLTGYDTGVAADTGVEVNRHTPGVAWIRVFGIKGCSILATGYRLVRCLGEIRILGIFGQGCFPDELASFERKMLLSNRKRVLLASLLELGPGSEIKCIARTDGVGVEANTGSDMSGTCPAVAKGNRD